jgi:hypothetical protein
MNPMMTIYIQQQPLLAYIDIPTVPLLIPQFFFSIIYFILPLHQEVENEK